MSGCDHDNPDSWQLVLKPGGFFIQRATGTAMYSNYMGGVIKVKAHEVKKDDFTIALSRLYELFLEASKK